MSELLLQVDELSLFRGDRCLFVDLNFSLACGQVLQLVGDNGTGKTSLLRALCMLQPVENGSIRWRGEKLPANRDNYLGELCYAGHADAIKLDLTPIENFRFYAELCGDTSVNANRVIEQIGLSSRADLPCRLLSAGQQRRVALSRLLIGDPSLWLLDEPLTALDAHGRSLVSRLICGHVERGGAVLFTTHQPLSLDSVRVDLLDLNSVQLVDEHDPV